MHRRFSINILEFFYVTNVHYMAFLFVNFDVPQLHHTGIEMKAEVLNENKHYIPQLHHTGIEIYSHLPFFCVYVPSIAPYWN